MNQLPEGTKIKIEYERSFQKIVIPHKSGGIFRIFIALFMIFWLGGWATGWVSAAKELSQGNGPADAFLIFWLCGWTVGGFFAIWMLYRLLRPSVPETIVLANPSIVYDSGIEPFQMSFGFRSQHDFWKKLFQKRTKTEFTYENIKTLKLREFGDGNRLTIDKGNKRIELATGATELEREWLHELIQRQYS